MDVGMDKRKPSNCIRNYTLSDAQQAKLDELRAVEGQTASDLIWIGLSLYEKATLFKEPMEKQKLRPKRDYSRHNNPTLDKIRKLFGEPCPDYEPDCPVCLVYELYDDSHPGVEVTR